MSRGAPLKSGNQWRFAGILVGNSIAFGLLASGVGDKGPPLAALIPQASKLLPLGALAVLAGLLSSQLSPTAKAGLVFFRMAHPLPGCRAFSEFVEKDPRVDRAALARDLGAFPVEPDEQNRAWYRLYKAVGSDPSVIEAHGRYLFYRDYATLALFVAIGSVPLARQWEAAMPGLLGVLGAAVMQLILTIRAAQTSGERLVCNVLATYSTKHSTNNG